MLAGVLSPPRADNFDPIRHPAGVPGLRLRDSAGSLCALTRRHSGIWATWRDLATDRQSREALLDLAAFRVLGARRIELGVGAAATRRMGAFIEEHLVVKRQTTKLEFMDWWASEYDLAPLGSRLKLEVHPIAILHTFLLDQYRCSIMPEANVRSGDVVIDGGACWGDTALYFAERVGAHGQVVGFEFDAENIRLLERNLGLNHALADRIHIRNEALWRSAGETLHFASDGPATRVGATPGGLAVSTGTIDDLVASGVVPRVDFIKLDVEGAELDVLHGARETLRTMRPRMAIALYHKPGDVYDIPNWIKEQDPSYKFCVEHRTLHREETMLFAYA